MSVGLGMTAQQKRPKWMELETPAKKYEGWWGFQGVCHDKRPIQKHKKRMRWWGDVMENLGNLAEKKQIKVRASMVTFFMLLSKSEQGKDDTWQSCKALEAHYIPVNANPVDGRGVYELIYHAADHLLRSNKGEFRSTMGQDVVALQTHRTNNKASRYHAWF